MTDSNTQSGPDNAGNSDLLLRAVINGTSDPVYVKDLSGRIIMANAALAKITGKDF